MIENKTLVEFVFTYLKPFIPEEIIIKMQPILLDSVENRIKKSGFITSILPFANQLPESPDIIFTTLVCAWDRMRKYYQASDAEIIHFTYDFSSYVHPEMPCYYFCRNKVGRTFTLKQIQKMDNGNLSPVLFFGGGWGCNHRWEPNPFADIGIK